MQSTDYLAIYGALLSTGVFLWTVSRARSRIKVCPTFAIETKPKTKSGLGISIQNPSAHTAHITNVSILYPYRKVSIKERLQHLWRYKSFPINLGWCNSSLSLHNVEDGCPTSIEPGKAHWIVIDDEVVQKIIKDATKDQLKIVVQDALWRNKYSPKFNYVRKQTGAH